MTILIFGKKGTGKSTLARKYINHNTIIFDVNNEYSDITNIVIDKPENFLAYMLGKNKLPIRLMLDENDTEKVFTYLTQMKNITLLIDELHLYVNQYNKVSKLFKIARLQRHYNHTIIGITQRLNEVNKIIFSQTDKIITFTQTDIRDLQILEKFGFNPESVKNLHLHKYLTIEY